MGIEQTINKTEQEPFKKYEEALRKFLKRYFDLFKSDSVNKRNFSPMEVDFSAPRGDDMEAIRQGNYVISNITTTPRGRGDNGINFHFYVGQTEIHIMNKAADEVEDITRELNKEDKGEQKVMRAVVQRVKRASVKINNEVVGKINNNN